MDILAVIKEFVGYDSYSKGKNIPSYHVRYVGNVNIGKTKEHHFRVASQHTNTSYAVYIDVLDNKLVGMHCSCPQFSKEDTCKHVAAALLKHYEDMMEVVNNYSLNILQEFSEEEFNKPKEILKLELEIEFIKTDIKFKVKIGTNKTYTITQNKVYNFIAAYKNNTTYTFGKGFTYDPKTQVFSLEDKKIFDYLFNHEYKSYYYYYSDPLEVNEREFAGLIPLLKNKEFQISDLGIVKNITTLQPKIFNLDYKDREYNLYMNTKGYYVLDSDCKYLYHDQIMYLIDEKVNKLIKRLVSENLTTITFKEEELPLFKKGLLRVIKDNVNINDSVRNIVIPKEVKAELYFDLYEDYIACQVKFNYDGKIVLDNDLSVVHDVVYEQSVYQSLEEYNFRKNNQGFILREIDAIGEFLEYGLLKISEKYVTFTSEKLKRTNLIKKSRVESSFGIGKEGILSYEFSVADVSSKEIGIILDSLKAKKKYYKLKSGEILKLTDNKELEELGSVIEDLELSKKDLEDSRIEIPKYKAFYLDNLRNSKYHNIKTNSLFDEFITNFLKYKDTEIMLSKQDNELLRGYQKDGVKWLYTIYKCDLGGILADEMGLGKSFQTICFLKQVLKEKKDAKVLIVCPTSLCYNWQIEFEKYGEGINYVVLAENKKQRELIFANKDNYQVFITSYGLVRNDFSKYEEIAFEVCIIDEAQTIKNYQADMTKCVKKINAKTKIALSGTPLENSVLELWSIFDFIMPGYLSSIMKFKEKYQVKDVSEKSLSILKNLNYQIKPFILRRLKKDVIKDLPEKLENVVYLELPEVQKAIYQKEVRDTKEKMDKLIQEKGYKVAQFEILKLLLRLREVCIDPGMLYDAYQEDVVKYDYLLDIVNSYIRDNHKILIFSTFKRVINKVKKMFDEHSISSYVIDGTVKGKTRVELVDAFNKDKTNCFLITLKAGGTGLNLTAADIVIHLDIWWNPQVENQATDRAHRIGQTKNVTVVKLVTKGTIEEKILELQQKKKIVADNVMEGHSNAVLSKLSEKDIRDLLTIND